MTGPGRAGLATAAVTALAASFLAGVAVAGGTTTAPPPGPDDPPATSPLTLVNADLRVPGGCEDLLDSYVERGAAQVTAWGWEGPEVYYAEDAGGAPMFEAPLSGGDSAAGSAATPTDGGRVTEQGSSATGTNVQEVGVDEPDTVKTDGALLARVVDEDVVLHDLSGSAPVEVGELDLPAEVDGAELLLAGDTLVVVGSVGDGEDTGDTRLLTYDVSDPGAPVLVDHRGYSATTVRAVQHDDDVRLVLTSRLPDLDFVEPRFWRSPDSALERNREVVRDSSLEDWLPSVTTYDAQGAPDSTSALLDCGEVVVPAAEGATLGTMAVVGFDVDDPTDAETLGIATDTALAYFSPDRMYLAASRASAWWDCVGCGNPTDPGDDLGRSRIYAFELDGTDTTYAASGVVDGVIADRWSMDEHAGVLRVAVGPSIETGNFSSVITLREDDGDLEEAGRVDDLGIDEDITSVRWFDDLAIVVTFRRVDPLYAVDLADPDRPRLLGELKIPGFSEYLHPIDGDRLIGLGQDADGAGTTIGGQAALFDVSDLTAPRRTDTVAYAPGSVVGAAADPRQFTWLPDRDTALAVVSDGWEGRTGTLSVLTVVGNRLVDREIEVEHGSDVALVRTVPLPDGRVVLVTGDDVSFLDL